jgi:ABC-type lipoprotein export system ATPase subunit
MTAAIDVRDAFRIHHSAGGTAVALQGLSLRVERGELVVVLGPSGSGKTTLLRVLGGFDVLSAGGVRVLGHDVGGLGAGALARFRARHLGLLDQHYARALSPDLSCLHSVALSLELLGEPRRSARAAAAALLERVGLGDRLDDRPGRLSGGEQQRVALCASLVHHPPLLLADEPAGELDQENAGVVYALIAEIAREYDATALVVSHDPAAAAIADRLVYVRDGRVIEEGRPGRPPALVVTEPGWIRIPDSLLEALGGARRLRAELRGNELALTAAPGPARPPAGEATPLERRPPPLAAAAAEVRELVKRFPGAARPVLDALSRAFPAGTFTAVVGRSGSGKTTLLHLLAGLDQPSAGEVLVQGREIGRLGRAAAAAVRREQIALVGQEPGLVPHLTARENVALGLQARGIAGDATAALAEVGLAARLDHRADSLSAGERQRVAIARAVAARPAILLADEPTARLDHANARAVADLLARLAHQTGAAVICATHDETLIERADDTLLLDTTAPRPSLRTLAAHHSG